MYSRQEADIGCKILPAEWGLRKNERIHERILKLTNAECEGGAIWWQIPHKSDLESFDPR